MVPWSEVLAEWWCGGPGLSQSQGRLFCSLLDWTFVGVGSAGVRSAQTERDWGSPLICCAHTGLLLCSHFFLFHPLHPQLNLDLCQTRGNQYFHACRETQLLLSSLFWMWPNSVWLVLDDISQYCPKAVTFWNKQPWLMQGCGSGSGIQVFTFLFILLSAQAE